MHPILRKLEAGDRRSIGRSNEVVAAVLARPALFGALFSGFSAADPLLRMRAADAIEKITARRPELLRPYKDQLIRDAAEVEQKEVRWHIAQMLPRLALNARERQQVLRILLTYLNDRSSIVRTFTMQALVDIARSTPTLRAEVFRHVRELTLTGTPAMKARGRKLLVDLGGQTARSTTPRHYQRVR